jgi:hypothetical protein
MAEHMGLQQKTSAGAHSRIEALHNERLQLELSYQKRRAEIDFEIARLSRES